MTFSLQDLTSPTVRSSRPLVLFLPDLSGGGGERITLTLGQELAERGLEVDLVVGRASGPLLHEVPPRLNLVDLDRPHLRAALPDLARYLRVRRPQWIMPTVDHANVLGSLAARLSRSDTKVVLRPSTTLSVRAECASSTVDRLQFALSRHCYRSADAIVACSRGMADDLTAYCSLPEGRVAVIPNASVVPDLQDRASSVPDHPWFATDQPPVVLGVGRLDHPKDFPLLVRAFAAARKQRHARLILLGDGPQRDLLEDLAHDLGVADDVALLGHVANPYPFMAHATVFALASTREGLPGVLIEAMACGAPVVATDCPSGPREILADGAYGRLTPVGEVAPLATALVETIDDPRPAPSSALDRFDAKTVADAYLELLNEVSHA